NAKGAKLTQRTRRDGYILCDLRASFAIFAFQVFPYLWRGIMDFGASMFMTDYCIPPAELGRALEERGFESLWNPEHSHIPLSRKTPFPGGGDLPKMYYDAMDP